MTDKFKKVRLFDIDNVFDVAFKEREKETRKETEQEIREFEEEVRENEITIAAIKNET